MEPTVESLTNFLKKWIDTIPRFVRHDHGLCIAKLNEFVNNNTLQIVESNNQRIHVQWKPHSEVHMELYIMKDSITIKDYTYVIPPFYQCTISL